MAQSTVVAFRNVRLSTAVLNSEVQHVCASYGTTLSEFLQTSCLIPFPFFAVAIFIGTGSWSN
jgi:hypothetical protein